MSETDKVFAGSVPENYDRYLVPLIFQSFAEDIARRVALISPSTVLETAAGTGVVTRAVAPKLAPDASYVVTDLNQPMIDYAAARQAADTRISCAARMHRRCRSKMLLSIWFFANSASCSFPIANWGTERRRGSSSQADISCSTYGIALRRTYSQTM